jgi:hypothetical protein
LGVLLVSAVVYQFFLSGPAAKPKRNIQPGATTAGLPAPASSSAPAAPKTRQLGAAAQQEAIMQALLADTTPLNLRMAAGVGGKSEPSERGNIFGYYKPPPPPPQKQPDPPPIRLLSLTPQSAVAGTPRPVTLVVNGNKIPADAQMFIDGSPRATKRMSETQLSTVISPADYSSPRSMTIDVKSKSNPAENSNSVQFLVQQSPEPQFIFKGRLGSLNQPQTHYAVVELTSTKETKRAKVGDTIMGIWRVDAITADGLEVTLTQYDIKKRVLLQEKK